MPAKSTSPEAAQQKVWKAELKTLEAQRRSATKGFDQELKAAQRESAAASKAARVAEAKMARLVERQAKARPAAYRTIDRRIAILRGRLGL